MISLSTHIPDFVFSASLPDKVVISNDHSVDVAITSDLGNVYSSVLAVYNGNVTIYDFRRLIETYMEFKEQTVCRFSIKGAEDELKSFFVVYSTLGVDRDAKEWCNSHFLTTREAGEFSVDENYTLSFVKTNDQPETVEFFHNNLMRDGTIAQAHATGNTFKEPNSLCSVEVAVPVIFGMRWNTLSVSVRVGARSFTFFRHEQPFNFSLKFKNAFGVWEVAHLCAVTERKTTDGRKTANIMRRVAVYGAERKVSFTSTTAPLPIDTARWLGQLATSPQVRLFPGGQEIIMLNSPVEVSDSRTDSNSVKFSWQFPDGADHSAERRYLHIFQNPFNDVFA